MVVLCFFAECLCLWFVFSFLFGCFSDFRALFSNFYVVLFFGCSVWLWEVCFPVWFSPLLDLVVRRKGNVYVVHAFGCVSVCFQFACVLLSDFRALFSNFYIVHGYDFTTFLWLRSLFSSLVLFRCSVWLWEEKVMFMLCMPVLPFPPNFIIFFRCFSNFRVLFF